MCSYFHMFYMFKFLSFLSLSHLLSLMCLFDMSVCLCVYACSNICVEVKNNSCKHVLFFYCVEETSFLFMPCSILQIDP